MKTSSFSAQINTQYVSTMSYDMQTRDEPILEIPMGPMGIPYEWESSR